MNILIINVSLRKDSPVKLFPVGLGYIATAIKNAGFKFDLLDIDAHRYTDRQVEIFMQNKKYDVICLGCIVTGYKIIKELALLIKKYHPYSIIIAGNSVATSIPEILLRKTSVDIAVIGEGDDTIVEILNSISEDKSLEDIKGICFLKDGIFIKTPERPYIKNISLLSFLDYSIFDIEVYIENSKFSVPESLIITKDKREQIRALPVNTARGCIGKCTFCYHVFKDIKYRYRTAEAILEEIKLLIDNYRLNYIFFWDELTFYSKKQALNFAQKILDEGLHFYWHCPCRADLFYEDEDIYILNKLKKAGCTGLGYSLESADSEILKTMNKNISVEQFSKQTSLLKKVGIATWTSLVLGYPQETPETIKKTFDCCIKNKIYPSSGFLLPQPGSEIYNYAIKTGFIQDEEDYLYKLGDRQDLRLNMTNMSDDDFKFYVKEGLKECNKALNIGLNDDELIKTKYFRSTK